MAFGLPGAGKTLLAGSGYPGATAGGTPTPGDHLREVYQLKAEVVTIGGLPAHAGQNFLVEYARSSRETLQKLILVHGEAKPAQALTEKLNQVGINHIAFPDLHSVMEV
jgi:predicted metal-dependent RNase